MSRDSYTVPSLNLTSSRSKKNIPTKDVYQSRILNYDEFKNSTVTSSANNYMDKREQQHQNNNTGNIVQSRITSNYGQLPPKSKVYESRPPVFPRNQTKQISRNVYLSSQEMNQDRNKLINQYISYTEVREQTYQQNSFTNQAMQRAKQVLGHSSSQKSLLRNPQSRIQIEKEVMKQTNNLQFKKIDINKALFQRKLAKLFQQIDFYEDELNNMHSDSLDEKIQELQNIKKESSSVNQKILDGLNALIA